MQNASQTQDPLELLNSRLQRGDLLTVADMTALSPIYVRQIMSGHRPANSKRARAVVETAKVVLLRRWQAEVRAKQDLIEQVEAI